MKRYWRSTRTHRHITPQTSVTQITMKQICFAHPHPHEQLKERASAKISTCASSSHPHLGNHSYVWRKLKVQKFWKIALQAIEHNDETTYDETWPFSAYAHLWSDRIRTSKQKTHCNSNCSLTHKALGRRTSSLWFIPCESKTSHVQVQMTEWRKSIAAPEKKTEKHNNSQRPS